MNALNSSSRSSMVWEAGVGQQKGVHKAERFEDWLHAYEYLTGAASASAAILTLLDEAEVGQELHIEGVAQAYWIRWIA